MPCALYLVDFSLLPNIPRLQFTKLIFFASEIKRRAKKERKKVLLPYPGKLQVVYRVCATGARLAKSDMLVWS